MYIMYIIIAYNILIYYLCFGLFLCVLQLDLLGKIHFMTAVLLKIRIFRNVKSFQLFLCFADRASQYNPSN